MTNHQLITDGYGVGSNLILEGYASSFDNRMLHRILTAMEKKSIGRYLFTVGTAEPGLDNFDNPLRRILTDMEKKSIGQYLGVPGLFEPGMDNFDCPLRRILRKMNKT